MMAVSFPMDQTDVVLQGESLTIPFSSVGSNNSSSVNRTIVVTDSALHLCGSHNSRATSPHPLVEEEEEALLDLVPSLARFDLSESETNTLETQPARSLDWNASFLLGHERDTLFGANENILEEQQQQSDPMPPTNLSASSVHWFSGELPPTSMRRASFAALGSFHPNLDESISKFPHEMNPIFHRAGRPRAMSTASLGHPVLKNHLSAAASSTPLLNASSDYADWSSSPSSLFASYAHPASLQNPSVYMHSSYYQQQQNNNNNSNNADIGQWSMPPTAPSAVSKKISLYKTELCRTFEETGYCRYGARCQFAHALTELRQVPRHPRYKTEICKTFWELGCCPYGKRCCFIHTENNGTPFGSNAGSNTGSNNGSNANNSTSNVSTHANNGNNANSNNSSNISNTPPTAPRRMSLAVVERSQQQQQESADESFRVLSRRKSFQPSETASLYSGGGLVGFPFRSRRAFDWMRHEEEETMSTGALGMRPVQSAPVRAARVDLEESNQDALEAWPLPLPGDNENYQLPPSAVESSSLALSQSGLQSSVMAPAPLTLAERIKRGVWDKRSASSSDLNRGDAETDAMPLAMSVSSTRERAQSVGPVCRPGTQQAAW